MRRTIALLVILILAGTAAITACSFSLPAGSDGAIALMPFWDEELGIQGVQPIEGWSEDAALVQNAISLSRTEAVDAILAATNLDVLPEVKGQYQGSTLLWDLFEFESHVEEIDLDTVHVDLAVAEAGSTIYVVALVAVPETYETNQALYNTVFTHALYALEPME